MAPPVAAAAGTVASSLAVDQTPAGGAADGVAQVDWDRVFSPLFSPEAAFVLVVVLLGVGVVLSYVVKRSARQLMVDAGVPESVEGTPFERTARGLGTSTVGIVSWLAALFVFVGAVVVALNLSELFPAATPFWSRFLSDLFIAVFTLIVGLIGGDKAKLVVSERLRSVKLPEVGLIPELVKYSIFYLAALIALGQLRVDTNALLILLAAYAFGLVFLSGLAFKDLLAAGAAGLYLVLNQPYGIGDEVVVDDKRGIVQEVGMLVTHVESDQEVYIVPNHRIFASGIVRVRQ